MGSSLGKDLEGVGEDDCVAPILHSLEGLFEFGPFHFNFLMGNLFSSKRSVRYDFEPK